MCYCDNVSISYAKKKAAFTTGDIKVCIQQMMLFRQSFPVKAVFCCLLKFFPLLYQYYRRLRIALLGLICCSFSATAMAGDNHNMLSARVAAAAQRGTEFKEVSLFSAFSGVKHTAILQKETLLQPMMAQINSLFLSKPQGVSVKLRNEEGKIYTLEMLQSQPVSGALTTGTINGNGRNEAGYTAGLHYQGHLAGIENSMATMSLFANGDVMILFSNEEGNFVVGKLEDGSNNYIFYNDEAMIHRPALSCGVKEKADLKQPDLTGAKGTRVLMCNKVQIYWEVAYNFYTSKASNLTNTQNYITGLFNQVQAMYANDNIAIELKSLYIWTAQDDYPTNSSNAALDKFRGYWNTMGNTFDGNLAHLLTRDNGGSGGGNGGLAYVDVMCSRTYGYGYSDIYGTLQTVPTYSWDVEVVTHETGHNMGSNHTHWCGWNTGVNGTCGAIDNCTTLEAGSSCTTCGSTYLNSASTTAWKGTVMSYCHLVARGINLANGFGPLPAALIRSNVSTEACLVSVINATLTVSPICNNDGAISITYPANNFGTAPYTYAWSNGATTQNISGIVSPFTYSVDIADSNSCMASFSAAIGNSVNAGNGIALTEAMPVCCQNTTRTITLKATAPTGLKATCETVYWLRSDAPLTTMAAIQAKFDTAQAANIIISSNAGSISNIVGARLTVSPPATCAGPVTYYYTPVAVRYVRTADSVVSNVPAGNGVAYMNGSVQIGASTALPDQRTAVGACVLTDTPASRSLVVTITGYTGRANNMRLIVQDGNSNILYQKFALAGNGTYTIDPALLKDNFLGALKIFAVDFNCTTGASSTCASSAVSIAVARKVVYAAAPLRLSPACTVGTPVRVDYAPSGCTNLAVGNTIVNLQPSLYPNPATQSATLKYNTNTTGNVTIKVTDLAGKVVWVESNNMSAGYHEQTLDVHAWAKGMYFVNLSNGTNKTTSLKLTIE